MGNNSGAGPFLKLSGVKLPLDFQEADVKRAAAKKLRLPERAVLQVRLAKKSVDARKKEDVHFVCQVEAAIDGDVERLLSRRRDPSIQKAVPYRYELPRCGKLSQRPVVVGFGPAGMFAALLLAQCGQAPIVLERGKPVEDRERSVQRFWKERVLDPQSNVQFGEGGAGTFSDGKLTTGTGDSRIRKVLEELVRAGAPEEILYEAKPHIGTDKLPGVVRAIREQVIALGGQVRFSTQAAGFVLKDGRLAGLRLRTPQGEEILECSQVPGTLLRSCTGWDCPWRPRPFPWGPASSTRRPSSTGPSMAASPGTRPWGRRTTSSPATWKTAGGVIPSACAPAGTSPGRPLRRGAWSPTA